jgi:hypothetical protein
MMRRDRLGSRNIAASWIIRTAACLRARYIRPDSSSAMAFVALLLVFCSSPFSGIVKIAHAEDGPPHKQSKCELLTSRSHPRPIPLDSEDGHILITACGVASPPIRRLPLGEVEPPRNVPAAQWKSPYCGHWEDGCTECRRHSEDGPLECHAKSSRQAACEPRFVMCDEAMDYEQLDRICPIFAIREISEFKGGILREFGSLFRTSWFYVAGKGWVPDTLPATRSIAYLNPDGSIPSRLAPGWRAPDDVSNPVSKWGRTTHSLRTYEEELRSGR